MKIVYDPSIDLLQITFSDGTIDETAQIAPDLVLDYDDEGRLSGIEIYQASVKVKNPYAVAYEVGQANQDKPKPRVQPPSS